MQFYSKKINLLKNATAVIKNKQLFFRLLQNGTHIYFKYPVKLFFFVSKSVAYVVSFQCYRALVSGFASNVLRSFYYNLLWFRLFFYVRGYNCEVIVYKKFLVFFLGYSHGLVYQLPPNVFAYSFTSGAEEFEFYVESSRRSLLLNLLVDFKSLRKKSDLYGGKGVFLAKEVFVARKTKKEIKK